MVEYQLKWKLSRVLIGQRLKEECHYAGELPGVHGAGVPGHGLARTDDWTPTRVSTQVPLNLLLIK